MKRPATTRSPSASSLRRTLLAFELAAVFDAISAGHLDGLRNSGLNVANDTAEIAPGHV